MQAKLYTLLFKINGLVEEREARSEGREGTVFKLLCVSGCYEMLATEYDVRHETCDASRSILTDPAMQFCSYAVRQRASLTISGVLF